METPVLENDPAQLIENRNEVSSNEISLIELATILLRRKRMIGVVALGAAILAAAIVSFIPPSYSAEATLLPPQQQQSSLAALSGAMGALSGSAGASLGLKNPADLYVGILGSRTIADNMVKRFQLQHVYGKKFASDARKALKGHTSFTAGKDTMIKISVDDRDPRRAADLANGYVEELYKLNSRIATTDAGQRRLFFEQELQKEKDALADAEIELKKTQQATGLLAPAGQAEALIRTGAQLRAEIASREVELQAMRSYATDENPRVQVLRKEVESLQGQLGQLEAKSNGSNSVFNMSAGKLPDSTLEYIRKTRDLKYHETMFELMAKQYEAARIDEAKHGPVLQVVDRAVVPDKKNWPPKMLLTIAAGVLGFIMAAFWAFVSHALQKSIAWRDQANELVSLATAVRA